MIPIFSYFPQPCDCQAEARFGHFLTLQDLNTKWMLTSPLWPDHLPTLVTVKAKIDPSKPPIEGMSCKMKRHCDATICMLAPLIQARPGFITQLETSCSYYRASSVQLLAWLLPAFRSNFCQNSRLSPSQELLT